VKKNKTKKLRVGKRPGGFISTRKYHGCDTPGVESEEERDETQKVAFVMSWLTQTNVQIEKLGRQMEGKMVQAQAQRHKLS